MRLMHEEYHITNRHNIFHSNRRNLQLKEKVILQQKQHWTETKLWGKFCRSSYLAPVLEDCNAINMQTWIYTTFTSETNEN